MNNGEAIKIINQYDMNFHWNDGEPIPASHLAEAFDLAISALEKQEQDDCIDCAESVLDELPSADVVEVVRCRDCIYQKPDTVYGGNWCWVHREPFMLKTLDGFCSYGERREE